jgi:hypothetical protein
LTAQTATARWLLGFAKQSHALLANPFFSQLARGLGEYHKKNLQFEHREYLDRVRFAIGWHLGITLGVCMFGLEPGPQSACHLLGLGAIVQAWL